MPSLALQRVAPAAPPPPPHTGGAHLWSKRIRTGAPFHLAAHGAAVDGAGNLLVAGRFGERLDLTELGGPVLHGEPGQIFVLGLDPRGALRWADRLGGAAGDRPPWAVAADREGGCFLAGEAEEGTFLIKLDAAGKHLWTRRLSDLVAHARDRQPLSLATDDAGNVLVLGHGAAESASVSSSTPPSSSTTLAYLFLLRFDPTGVLLWSRRFGCSGRAHHPRLLVDAGRNAILSGYFQGTLTFGSNVLRTPPGWDIYLAKLDVDGDPVWSKRFAGKDTSGFSAGVDAAGDVVVGGAFQREIDVGAGPLRSEGGTRALFLAKLDPGGRPRWAKRYPGDTRSRFELSLAVDRRGAAIFAGYFEGVIDLGGVQLRSARENESIFVARIDASGARAWSRAVKGPRDQTGLTVHAAPDGDVLVLGSFGGSLSFGGEPLWNEGQPLDLFVARLAGGEPS